MQTRPAPPPRAKPSEIIGALLENQPVPGSWAITSGVRRSAQRLVIFGTGGVGKTTLAALIPGRSIFIDLEGGTNALANIDRVEGITRLQELRDLLQGEALRDYDTIVLDSATKLEDLCLAHALAFIPHEKGQKVNHIEGYGYGKGYQHVYDVFMLVLQDFDRCIRRGQNVCLIAHECIANVPNPGGDDFIRFEPHLQAPASGKASIRNRVIQWADHVLFIGYDVITADGKGKGGGTRTIWTSERPDHIAKSRLSLPQIPYNDAGDGTIWSYIFPPTEDTNQQTGT